MLTSHKFKVIVASYWPLHASDGVHFNCRRTLPGRTGAESQPPGEDNTGHVLWDLM